MIPAQDAAAGGDAMKPPPAAELNPDAPSGGTQPIDAAARGVGLRQNLAEVRERMRQACSAADRELDELTLIAVTKFFPVTDAALLAAAGVGDLGESRDQEASAKVADFGGLSEVKVRWHFIGRLQSNKARSVARYADVVHSVDRLDLAKALDSGVRRAGREPLAVLVQLSLDADPERGGSAATELERLADQVAGLNSLKLAGVMAIAPLDVEADHAYGQLEEVAGRVRVSHPEARMISAGMSNDLEAAVRHGATHVRIGTALLGRRATPFR